MKTNIKFKLVNFEKALAFQVIEQIVEWVSNEFYQESQFKAKNGVMIRAFSFPHFQYCTTYGKIINLRGENFKEDYHLSCKDNFRSNQQRDRYYNLIIEALKEWSQHVYKITNREPQEPKKMGDIWEI